MYTVMWVIAPVMKTRDEVDMKKFQTVICIFTLLVFEMPLFSQISFQGNNYMETAWDSDKEEKYFENWTDLSLQYQGWRAGMRFEIHEPPFPFSQDTESKTLLSQGFLEYQLKNLNVTVGHFYTLLFLFRNYSFYGFI